MLSNNDWFHVSNNDWFHVTIGSDGITNFIMLQTTVYISPNNERLDGNKKVFEGGGGEWG